MFPNRCLNTKGVFFSTFLQIKEVFFVKNCFFVCIILKLPYICAHEPILV